MYRVSQRSGFSLVELSILLTILAIAVTAGMSISTAEKQVEQVDSTYEKILEIRAAISSYVATNDTLPCPAPIDALETDAEFGRAASSCVDNPPSLRRVESTANSGNYMMIGGVPFYDLGLPREFIGDTWNSRFFYVVSEAHITALVNTDSGFITVEDESGNTLTDNAAWLVFSTGNNSLGGYNLKYGTALPACDTDYLEAENCDLGDVYLDAPFNEGDTDAEYFDDIILWETVSQIYSG